MAFSDARRLSEYLGFELRRVSGSHHVFAHPDIAELLNLQSVRGQARPSRKLAGKLDGEARHDCRTSRARPRQAVGIFVFP